MRVYAVCVHCVYSRKERWCNGCVRECQHETTSECEDTDTDNELSSSTPPPDSSPAPARDSATSTLISSSDSQLCAAGASAAGSPAADEVMSQSAAVWSVRGSAYSALSWVSGVMSRSFVRSPSDSQPAVGSDATNADVVTADVGGEWTTSAVDGAQNDVTSSSVTDAVSADTDVNAADVSAHVTTLEAPTSLSHSDVSAHVTTLESPTSLSHSDVDAHVTTLESPTSLSHSAVLPWQQSSVTDSTHDMSHGLSTDDAVHRYPLFTVSSTVETLFRIFFRIEFASWSLTSLFSTNMVISETSCSHICAGKGR